MHDAQAELVQYCNDLASLSAHQKRYEKAVIGLDSRVYAAGGQVGPPLAKKAQDDIT